MITYHVTDHATGETYTSLSARIAAVKFADILSNYDLLSPEPLSIVSDLINGSTFELPGIATVCGKETE